MARPTQSRSAKYGGKISDKNARTKVGSTTKVSHTAGKLPRGWVEYQTADGEVFFHNFYTDEATWDVPTASEHVEIGKNAPPKKVGHARSDGRTNLPPCMVMALVLVVLFVGLLKGLWFSVMKCIGFGSSDSSASRMVAQEQDDTLNRKDIQLVAPLKPPELLATKPLQRDVKPVGIGKMIANALTQSAEDEEPIIELEPPRPDNFARWAPKLAAIWGKWLPEGERHKLNRLVKEWAKEQVARWELGDRPVQTSRSEGAPDLERCGDLKTVLHKQLGELRLHKIQDEFNVLQEESTRNSIDAVDKLEQLKLDLKQEECNVKEEAREVEERRKLVLQWDPSYSFGERNASNIPAPRLLDDSIRSASRTSLKHVMRQITRKNLDDTPVSRDR